MAITQSFRPTGERNGRSVLKAKGVVAMRTRRAEGESYEKLGEEFGVNPKHVARVCRGLLWKDAGGPIEVVSSDPNAAVLAGNKKFNEDVTIWCECCNHLAYASTLNPKRCFPCAELNVKPVGGTSSDW
jgi:hypothetical protein